MDERVLEIAMDLAAMLDNEGIVSVTVLSSGEKGYRTRTLISNSMDQSTKLLCHGLMRNHEQDTMEYMVENYPALKSVMDKLNAMAKDMPKLRRGGDSHV